MENITNSTADAMAQATTVLMFLGTYVRMFFSIVAFALIPLLIKLTLDMFDAYAWEWREQKYPHHPHWISPRSLRGLIYITGISTDILWAIWLSDTYEVNEPRRIEVLGVGILVLVALAIPIMGRELILRTVEDLLQLPHRTPDKTILITLKNGDMLRGIVKYITASYVSFHTLDGQYLRLATSRVANSTVEVPKHK